MKNNVLLCVCSIVTVIFSCIPGIHRGRQLLSELGDLIHDQNAAIIVPLRRILYLSVICEICSCIDG